MTPEQATYSGWLRRLDSTEDFASLDPREWPEIAIESCRLALTASGVEDRAAVEALAVVEAGQTDATASASMRELTTQLDEAAFDAQEAGDASQYDSLFRQARAVSALAFALSQKPDEAIYEAAYAVGTPQELMRQLAA